MKRTSIVLTAAILLVLAVVGGGGAFSAQAAYPSQKAVVAQKSQASGSSVLGPFVSGAAGSAVSAPLSSLPVVQGTGANGEFTENPMLLIPGSEKAGAPVVDSVLRKITGPLVMPTPIVNVAGQINWWGVYPPDTVGDVGPNHYVQMVNSTGVLILNKTGGTVGGPYNFNQLFRGFTAGGGICETNQNGDPIILHDQMADRWFLSQFAFNSQSGPTFQCIAVSTSPDPTGSYYLYAFQTAAVGFDDYPHYGVWPDAYYMSANRFNAPGFAGASVALERERMLVGDPNARMVVFLTPNNGGHLPTDLDGGTLPPAGSPNYYLYPVNSGAGLINEYKFHVDWANPALSTYLGPFPITVAPWDGDLCAASREACIPQPGTTVRLEAISDRFMHRLAYRNFGTHESLVTNQTVDADATGRAGIRWYEFRDPNGARTVHQQGTFAPADGLHRWMGSIAMDGQGNMSAGYSVSSGTVYPSIRYAGRLVTDPLGQFSQGEETLVTGGGSETGPAGRWGDYSSMNIDPRDDCTFWYTQEYFTTTGLVNWKTRIGSFRFPGCALPTSTPVPTFTGTPPTSTSTPTASPTICAGGLNVTGSITNSDTSQTGAVVGGPATQCGQTPACPGMSSIPDPRHYDSYSFTNTSGSSQCVTVNIDATGCQEAGVGSVAYLGSFDPNALCTNYLASSGSNGPRYSYSFSVPAGATYIVVVRELSPGNGCVTYNLQVSPCSGGSVTPQPTSTSTAVVTLTATGTPTSCVPTYVAATATATIVTGGTRVDGTGCDDCTTQVTLPFPVSAYGTSYSTLHLSSNGWMQFGTNPGKQFFWDGCLPINPDPGKGGPYENAWFLYYDDLRTDEAGVCADCGVFTQTVGTAPNRQYLVRWKTTYFNQAGTTEFQAILTENSPVLSAVYGANSDSGAEAVAGLQRSQTGPFTQFSCDTAVLTNGLRIDYTPTGCATPTATATVTATPCTITFTDVPTTDPFYLHIRCLACKGIVSGYADGTFRPNNPVTRGQLAKMVSNAAGFNEPVSGQIFEDVPPTHTFYEFIQRLTNRGYMTGYPCTPGPSPEPCQPLRRPYFRPQANATRGQTAKIVANAAGFNEPVSGQTFEDVKPDHTFYEFIQRLANRNVMQGYPCGGVGEPCVPPTNRPYFRPQNDVTRGQSAKIVANTFFPDCAPRR